MASAPSFRWIDALVAVSLVALVIGLLLPHTGPKRRAARSVSNTVLARNVHQALVVHSADNNGWYAGFDGAGRRESAPIPALNSSYGTASIDGFEPVYRTAVLLRGAYLSPEQAISYIDSFGEAKRPAAVGLSITTDHFSYAMLRLSDEPSSARRSEWKATGSERAVVLSDRNIGMHQSVHTSPGDGWRGSVIFNDNHGEFTQDQSGVIASTTYALFDEAQGLGRLVTTKRDGLFTDDLDEEGNTGNDAAMVYQDATSYVNQK